MSDLVRFLRKDSGTGGEGLEGVDPSGEAGGEGVRVEEVGGGEHFGEGEPEGGEGVAGLVGGDGVEGGGLVTGGGDAEVLEDDLVAGTALVGEVVLDDAEGGAHLDGHAGLFAEFAGGGGLGSLAEFDFAAEGAVEGLLLDGVEALRGKDVGMDQ